MKKCKVISLFIALVMVASTFSLNAYAMERSNPYEVPVGNASFTVSTSFCAPGERTKIAVDIGENSQMSAASFTLKYDTSKLKAVSVDVGVVLKNGQTSTNISEDGFVNVSYANTDPCYDSGRIFEVEFEAIDNLSDTDTFVDLPISLSVNDLRNYDDYKINSSVKDGKITLIKTPYGDVNESGDITVSDALMVLYSAAGKIELSENEKILADVSGDGEVSASDALQILRYSAGIISNFDIFGLETPTEISVTEKGENSFKLSWKDNNKAIGYNVYINSNKVNESPIIKNEYLVDNLDQDTTYSVNVQAVNVLTESALSEPISVSTNKAYRTVVFKDWDGTILDTQSVKSGTAANSPAVNGRQGYTFDGWDADISNITEDKVITAKYKINVYNVIFDYQYDSQVSTLNYEYGSKLSIPNVIARDDYTLEGWYRDKNYTKSWNFDVDTVEQDIVLYAKWVTWSEWTTDATLKDNSLYETQEKTEYRTSTKSYTTSSSSSLSGWTKYDTKITGWTSWSSWQSNSISSSSSRKVETKTVPATYKTQYNYSRYKTASGQFWTGPTKGTWGGHSCTVYQEKGWSDSALSVIEKQGSIIIYSGNWYNQTTRSVVKTAAYKQYRYCDAVYTYYYYKWSPWTDWSSTKTDAGNDIQVQERTVYRYKLIQK